MSYLRRFVKDNWGQGAVDSMGSFNQKSWFGNFRAFFATSNEFHWDNSGVDLELIEQLILTRNDFQHNVDLLTPYFFQDDRHAEKYPESKFGHPCLKRGLNEPEACHTDNINSKVRSFPLLLKGRLIVFIVRMTIILIWRIVVLDLQFDLFKLRDTRVVKILREL
jgi:hypothetical protein